MPQALTATLPRTGRASASSAARTTVAAPAGTAAGAAVEISGLVKRFGDKTVLDGIDLSFRPGEFVAVVGRSGCGKSTLLRVLLGLESADAGSVRIAGAPVARAGGDVARFVFQEPRLLPWARVAENVALGASRKVPRERRLGLAGEALAEVGLADRAGEWPSVLSGGQRQRVALARALVAHPRLLALDEPLGALDALTRIEMQSFVERVWRHQGFTAVLVTHDVSEAVALADRIVLIDGGRVALDVAVPLPRPRQRGTAEFGTIEARVLDRLFARG
ncbi:ABC transporter ATP-binding protein [Oharaeibacter diazotrophicus]|uniref:Sulfonate transport system ATP-binding protein n=1 Tax=Oharaeibacter diazotrophicus TaxID=1920512 RepID=A0A4R6RG62_9HYPH|nr:ATP-binding cassette domain-containing protein [Oharaeibacter diazotrophicus]TDP85270.1 sulfonate transport system ATP-binding protein [Oharaeibacter diazotrophicus]BBE74241.1 aliphatic sulfonates import ATP-binding protein SsuB [Pleomorphomonas sp. SM30]GLS76070.1 aliphatic sulfonates import ATP-binding protein SsuB 1 [Oharaeibacter diazotrophicus]